jgi:hypothetical protein
MERIYHPYNLWEDYINGFYDNCSGFKKQDYINGILEMFNSAELTEMYMQKVIDEWVYSCEHNLSNVSLNRIAYIGQSACCLYCGAPSTITMEAWSLLSKETQNRSNLIAEKILNNWLNKN